MLRILIVLGLIIAGTLMATCYGVLHDQITYTISPEFYTKVRFEQINIPVSSGRWGVAQIAFINTWKIGFIISFVVALSGVMHQYNPKIIRYTIQAFCITVIVATFVTLLGVVIGLLNQNSLERLPSSILHPASFRVVQTIHNFSYIGGLIGMFIGVYWQFNKRKQDNKIISRTTDFIAD